MRGELSSVGSDQPLFSSPHPLSGTWETWMAPNVMLTSITSLLTWA